MGRSRGDNISILNAQAFFGCRLYQQAREKNERITWTQVADEELLIDGFTISKPSGPPRTYQVASPDPKFAAVVELMLSRTA